MLELVTVVVEANVVEEDEEVVDSCIVIVFLIGSDRASFEASQVNSSESEVWLLGIKVIWIFGANVKYTRRLMIQKAIDTHCQILVRIVSLQVHLLFHQIMILYHSQNIQN